MTYTDAGVCPESVYGSHDTTDSQGRCLLCRQKIEPKAQRPKPRRVESALVDAYRYTYDPDWGSQR